MGSCVSRCYDKDRSKKYEEEQKVEPKKMPVQTDNKQSNLNIHKKQQKTNEKQIEPNQKVIQSQLKNQNQEEKLRKVKSEEKQQEEDRLEKIKHDFHTINFGGEGAKTNNSGKPIKEGQYSIGNYVFSTDEKNRLGKGGCADVFKGKNIQGENEAAIKVIHYKEQDEQKLFQCRQEILRQQLLKSEGVVKIYSSKIFPMGKQNYFVIAAELMEGGQLKVPETGLPHQKALQLLKDFLKCYSFLYKKKLAHRDIKPQNILLTKDGKMKISDFGAAKEQTDKKTHITPGTLAYASPQQIRCREHTEKCDVYALGCMFFQFLVGFPPKFAGCVKGSNVMDMKKVNKKLEKKGVSKEMIEFLEGCLREKETVYMNKDGKEVEDPSKSRLSWEEVYLHPMFKKELNNIPRDVAGSEILLNLKTSAKSLQIDLANDILKQILGEQQLDSSQPKWISKEELYMLLQKKKIISSKEDIDRLAKMQQTQDKFDLKYLILHVKKLDEDQFSNYSPEESFAFWQMFSLQQQDKGSNGKEFIEELKDNSYQWRQQIQLYSVNFTTFPFLPPMHHLKKIIMKDSQIQVLEVKLNAPYLEQLTINLSQVERVVTIRGCPNLIYLNLEKNKLQRIQGIQMLSKLKLLDLADNRMRRICGIDHLKELVCLRMVGNRIKRIEGLSGCISLNVLVLAYNKINELSDHMIQMANTKAPLEEIQLCTLYAIVDENNIVSSKSNRSILEKFKNLRPYSAVYLSVQYNEPSLQFSPAVEYECFKDGIYRIVNAKQPTKTIGIKQDEQGRRGLWLVDASNKSTQHHWYIKRLEDNDYCILTHNQKEIVMCNQLRPYQEDEQWEQDWKCRWVFLKEKRYNQKTTVSIKNETQPWMLRWDNEGGLDMYWEEKYELMKAEGKVKEGSHLWQIELINNSE